MFRQTSQYRYYHFLLLCSHYCKDLFSAIRDHVAQQDYKLFSVRIVQTIKTLLSDAATMYTS
jgi:hypothetical protein